MSNESKTVYAKAKYLRIAPNKLRRVGKLIRRKPVNEALPILKSLPHRGAEVLRRVLESAKANVVNNNEFNENQLIVSELLINEGPQGRRFQARARGRIFQILKRTSHVTVGVSLKEG